MNEDQQHTLEILFFIVLVIAFTANKSSQFWRTLFTKVPLEINGPQLPPLFNGINISLPGSGGGSGSTSNANGNPATVPSGGTITNGYGTLIVPKF